MTRRAPTAPDYLTVRLPSGAGLRALVQTAARDEERSANGWVVRAIRAALLRQAHQNKAGELAAALAQTRPQRPEGE